MSQWPYLLLLPLLPPPQFVQLVAMATAGCSAAQLRSAAQLLLRLYCIYGGLLLLMPGLLEALVIV